MVDITNRVFNIYRKINEKEVNKKGKTWCNSIKKKFKMIKFTDDTVILEKC